MKSGFSTVPGRWLKAVYRPGLLFGLGFGVLIALALGMLWILVSLSAAPPAAPFQITLNDLLPIFIALVAACLCIFAGWRNMKQQAQATEHNRQLGTQTRPIARIYPDGIERSDYKLIELALASYLARYREIALYPLQGGFTNALVFQIDFESDQSAILKLSRKDEIASEAQKYDRYVRGKLPIPQLQDPVYDGRRGILLYTYAGLSIDRSISFERFFLDTKRAHSEIETIIKKLFIRLRFWLAGRQTERLHLYRRYQMEEHEWERILRAIHALQLSVPASYMYQTNPLQAIQQIRYLFDERQSIGFGTQQSIVHGDLNSRNILIDGDNNVFVIDFAQTGEDCLLRDFCKLETEITYCLTKLSHGEDIRIAVELQKQLLFDRDGKPFSTLEDLLRSAPAAHTDARFNRMLHSIKALREIAASHMSTTAMERGSAEQYYIILLHYTVDVLRYQQCSIWSKLFALTSASLLYECLYQAGSQLREH